MWILESLCCGSFEFWIVFDADQAKFINFMFFGIEFLEVRVISAVPPSRRTLLLLCFCLNPHPFKCSSL
jgi:hypothetical protein